MMITRLEKTVTHRLIASRYPTVDVFDFMPDHEAVLAALALEGATNDRLNDVVNRLARLAPADIVVGESGATLAMAAFLHTTPHGGRFNGPELGAWYAALAVNTAIAETLYHHTRRLMLSAGGFPTTIEMRELVLRPKADLVDIRELDDAVIYRTDDYTASQQFADKLRRQGRDGIFYRSVRDATGTNIAIFKPRLVVPVTQAAHYRYDWDHDGRPAVHKLVAA